MNPWIFWRLTVNSMRTSPISREASTEKTRLHQHAVVKFIYVLKGRLALKLSSGLEYFEAGDSPYFHAHLSHGYSRSGRKSCSALVITAE